MTLRTTPLKSKLTLRTTGEGGAVAVGVSATREAERASDRDRRLCDYCHICAEKGR